MTDVVRRNTDKAFQVIGPNNPLLRMEQRDKELLWALLKLYSVASAPKSDAKIEDELGGQVARMARDAGKLADGLEKDVFHGTLANELRPYLTDFETLPVMLRAFAKSIGDLMDSVGKIGRKNEAFTNHFLVSVSEFVRLKTGSQYDEHIAALYQRITERDEHSDFSGDAIFKKREYLRKNYPALYQLAMQRANEWFERGHASGGLRASE